MLRTRVATALVLIALVLAVLFSKSFVLFAIVTSAFFAAAVWECARLFDTRQPVFIASIWTAVFVLALFKGDLSNATLLFGLCAAIWAIRLAPSLAMELPPADSFRNRMLSGLYGIAIFGCFIAITVLFRHSPLYLLSVMAIVWIADIGAYFAGKAFGKKKLAPAISPGKSWEGAIGGWLSVLVIAAGTLAIPQLHDTFAPKIYEKWGWIGLLLVMTVLVAFSIIGDLFESQLKRRAGFKDSSNLLPGHGGVLDRSDALIPVLPLAVLFGTSL